MLMKNKSPENNFRAYYIKVTNSIRKASYECLFHNRRYYKW